MEIGDEGMLEVGEEVVLVAARGCRGGGGGCWVSPSWRPGWCCVVVAAVGGWSRMSASSAAGVG